MSLWEINDPPLSPCLQLALSPASWSWSWRHLCPAWVLVLGSNRRAASCLAAVITGLFLWAEERKYFYQVRDNFLRFIAAVTCVENVNILFSTALNNGHLTRGTWHLTLPPPATRRPPPLDLEIRKLPLTYRGRGRGRGRVGVWEMHGSQILVKDLTS